MSLHSIGVRFASSVVLSFTLTAQAAAQPAKQAQWSWPEKPQNLQVLPADTPGSRLRPVMMGFTRALGVRCTHCHVGEEGKPLSTYDFASDANPKKNVARGMLRMLESINGQLKEIQPAKTERVNMWCHTCHHGRPEPRTLVEELSLVYAQSGADSTLARYASLRREFEDAGAFDFREPALNELGYSVLAKKDPQGAIAVFRANAEQFPESANAWDSLAEAFLAAGDTTQAIAHYEKALQLAPKSESTARALSKLRGTKQR